MTPRTGIKNDYAIRTPVSASDLNRRADILDTQPYGALQSIGAGVCDNDSDGNSLLVTIAGGTITVTPGKAIVWSGSSGGFINHPVWGQLTSIRNLFWESETAYVYATLIHPASLGGPETELGTADLDVILSDDDALDGALLLATINESGVVTDNRTFIKPDLALRRLAQIVSYLGYNPEELAKGTVAARLGALENPDIPGGDGGGDGGSGGSSGTTGPYAPLSALVALKNRVDDLEAQVDALKASLGTDNPLATRLVGRTETLRAEVSRTQASLVRVSPRSAQRFRAGIVIAGLSGRSERFADGAIGRAVYVGGNLQIDEANRRFV